MPDDPSNTTDEAADCLEAARAALAGLGIGTIAYSRALAPTARAILAERKRCAAIVREHGTGYADRTEFIAREIENSHLTLEYDPE